MSAEDTRKVKVYKVVLMVIDFDELGEEALREEIENVNYPNDCVSPHIMSVAAAEVEWSDEHPLNHGDTQDAEFSRLFAEHGELPQAEG